MRWRPFTTTNETFSLSNTGPNSLTWSLANTSSWLDASLGGGTLAAGGTTNVTVSLNSNAYSLTSGIYTTTVWFTNLNDSVVQSRQFTLSVAGPPIITCPSNITVTTTNPVGAVVNYTVTVSGSLNTSTAIFPNFFSGTNLLSLVGTTDRAAKWCSAFDTGD